MRRGALLLLAAGLVAWMAAGDARAQCAMCRTALESPQGRELAAAFRRAILLLLPVPFAAAGTIALLVVRARRRLRPGAGDGAAPPAKSPTGS